jgi:hypothetical protein
MWTPSRSFSAAARRSSLAVLTVAYLGAAAIVSLPAHAAPSGPAAVDHKHLRQQLDQRYEAFSISNGVLLKARQEKLGVRTVEVSGSDVVVNGAKVGPEVLRSWMGDNDSEPVLQLLSLSPADRQELFGFKRSASSTAPPAESPAIAPSVVEQDDEKVTTKEQRKAEKEKAKEEARRSDSDDESDMSVPPVPPVLPMPPVPDMPSMNTGSRVRFGGGVTVERTEVADDVVVFGGPVHVEGEVSHDVVSFGGTVRINGRVGGDVRAFGGSVHLGPRAEVMGDVSAGGGAVTREHGSRVHGSLTEGVAFPGFLMDDRHFPGLLPFGFGAAGHFAGLLIAAVLLLAVLLLARNSFERVDFELTTQPWKCLAVGVCAQVLFLPALVIVTVVLVISVIGCALILLYPVILVLLVLMALVGFASACHRVGRWLEARFGFQVASPWAALLLGFIAIEMWSFLAVLIGATGFHIFFVSHLLSLFGLAVRYVAWTSGFGGALLAYFRQRQLRRSGGLVAAGAVLAPMPPTSSTSSSTMPPPPPPALS